VSEWRTTRRGRAQGYSGEVLRSGLRVFTPARLLIAGLALFAVGLALWIIPSSNYIFLPDRAHAVAPLVSVSGKHTTADPHGGIYYVDVFVRKASLLESLLGGLHDGANIESPANVASPGISDNERIAIEEREMKLSQQRAATVALRAAGFKVRTVPSGALVSDVADGLPAAGKLEPTDVVTAVDGHRVLGPADLFHRLKAKRPGDRVTLNVVRGAAKKVFRLRMVADRPGSKRAIVGILVDQAVRIHFPVPVAIDAGNVGGPSAGLAFALEVLEQLGINVDHGYKIAATGEMFLDGHVGPIGGIEQKTIGAREAGVDAFLVPAGSNTAVARKYAHGLRIIPVDSFRQALHALATLPPNA